MPAVHRELRPQFALAALGVSLVGVAYLLLPAGLTVGPSWLALALDAVVLLPLLYAAFFRPLPHSMARGIRAGLQGVLTLALLSSLVLLVSDLPHFSHGGQLLRPAALLWVSNILLFAGWYWELDGDGPITRHLRGHPAVDFLFPQQSEASRRREWGPGFVDYLFLAFCFATALSPADTAPLSHRTKLLMMAEAAISLTIGALLIARAVNIF